MALPDEVALPETDDEVRQLLRQNGFDVPAGHLDQAIEAHTRGDWAAANAQLRTFVEGLFDAFATKIDATGAAASASSENRRALLASHGFLAMDRGEWTQDGKNFHQWAIQDAPHARIAPRPVRRGSLDLPTAPRPCHGEDVPATAQL